MSARDVIIEVDRVVSVEEAVAFRDAGATLIGVALGPDPRFEDTRFVSAAIAEAIEKAIYPARLVGIVPTYFSDDVANARARIEPVLALEPSFVHFYRGGVPDELSPMVHATGVPIIRDGAVLDADHGMFIDPNDPASLVRRQLPNPELLKAALYHLDLLTDTGVGPWTFLNTTALEWPQDAPQTANIAATCPFSSAWWKWARTRSCPTCKPFPTRAASSVGLAQARRAVLPAWTLNRCLPPCKPTTPFTTCHCQQLPQSSPRPRNMG